MPADEQGPVARQVRVAALIFDMDGVLVDSGDVYHAHWLRWGRRHGADVEQLARVHHGRPPRETIALVMPRLDADAEAARFNAELAEDRSADEVVALPGALELTAALPAGRWGVATSAVRSMAQRWLSHIGLPSPAALVTADDVERGKPSPDPYLLAAERLGVEAARCLVIEDAPAGIRAAKAAGATVLALRTSHADGDLAEADAIVGDLSDVSAAVVDGAIRVSWDAPAGSRRTPL